MKANILSWAGGVTSLIAISLVIMSVVFSTHRTPERQMLWTGLTVLLFLTLAVNAVMGAILIRKLRWKALLPFGIAFGGFVGCFGAMKAGGLMHSARISNELPMYQKFVRDVKAGQYTLPLRLSQDSLPSELRSCCYMVTAERDGAGEVGVIFWREAGFPVKHSGVLYYSGDTTAMAAEFAQGWSGRRFAPYWFEVFD